MPAKTSQDPILAKITDLAIAFASHVSAEVQSQKQVDAMYKILVTGNGQPPLPEIVRQHSVWIASQCDQQKEEVENQVKQTLQDKVDVKADRREAMSAKYQLWIMVVIQILGFALIGLEVFLHWK